MSVWQEAALSAQLRPSCCGMLDNEARFADAGTTSNAAARSWQRPPAAGHQCQRTDAPRAARLPHAGPQQHAPGSALTCSRAPMPAHSWSRLRLRCCQARLFASPGSRACCEPSCTEQQLSVCCTPQKAGQEGRTARISLDHDGQTKRESRPAHVSSGCDYALQILATNCLTIDHGCICQQGPNSKCSLLAWLPPSSSLRAVLRPQLLPAVHTCWLRASGMVQEPVRPRAASASRAEAQTRCSSMARLPASSRLQAKTRSTRPLAIAAASCARLTTCVRHGARASAHEDCICQQGGGPDQAELDSLAGAQQQVAGRFEVHKAPGHGSCQHQAHRLHIGLAAYSSLHSHGHSAAPLACASIARLRALLRHAVCIWYLSHIWGLCCWHA